ncbi:hypothetical protein A3K63_05000 [Candidatus Micrarchaeota archaeon RBG_16_49_10]|nr:MAG: hypothetical protein A3K63_05000 [Candidatus Micrarchaeota archaeon RBG_16_49_10]
MIAVPKASFIVACLLVIPAITVATSLGIWPPEINDTVSAFGNSYTSLYLFNPGSSDVDVDVSFACRDCERGVFELHPDVLISPSSLTVTKNTTPFNPQEIVLLAKNRLFVKTIFHPAIFGKEFRIPFYKPIIGREAFTGRITAKTTNVRTAIAVTAKANIELAGINPLLLLVLSLALVLAACRKMFRK